MAEKKSFDKFVQDYDGTSHTMGNPFGAQCVSGYQFYCSWLGISYRSGNAKDLWQNGAPHPGCTTITNWSELKKGDIVIWGAEQGMGYGHVAMFDHWVSEVGASGSFFGQNQGASASLDHGGPFCFFPIPRTGFLGAYRPNNITGNQLWTLELWNGFIISAKPQ